jgi:hypothetical protein
MRRLCVIAAMLGFAGAALSTRASADVPFVPSSLNSVLDKVIHLVGTSGGVLSTSVGDYTVIVRDGFRVPIPNSSVVLDFAQCGTNDVVIGATQPQAGTTFSCPDKTIRALTDASGAVTFRVVGSSQNPSGGATGVAVPCLRAFADGVLLNPQHTGALFGVKAVFVAPYDESGSGGFSVLDLAAFTGDLFYVPSPFFARSDFNGDDALTALDLANQVSALFGGAWSETAAACP